MLYAEEQVRAGIALLDERGPSDWREHVNWDILDMRDQDKCVLGQLFDGYEEGVVALGMLQAQRASDHGFYRCDGFWHPVAEHETAGVTENDRDPHNWEHRYELLTQTWKQTMTPVPA